MSGVLATSLSTNGPPLVFVLQARQLSAAAFRATISTVFALSNIGGLTLFIASGEITRDGIVAAAVTIPAMLFGQLLGFPIRKHVHGERFRWLVLRTAGRRGHQRHRQRRSSDGRTRLMIVAIIATAIAALANWYSRVEARTIASS